MAVAATNLVSYGDNTDLTSYSTGSWSPSATTLYLATVTSRITSGAPVHPTLSGNGLTWVEVASAKDGANGSNIRTTVFRAMAASPSAGALTADFGAETQLGCTILIDELTGTDTSGTNGSGAIIQSAIANGNSGTAPSVTLATLLSGSASFGGLGTAANAAPTAGSGYTSLGETHQGTPIQGTLSEYKATGSVTVDFADPSAGWRIVGVEVAVPAAGANRYLIETSATDGYLLESGSGVLLLEFTATPVTATPGTASLTIATFAPVVLTPRLATIGKLSQTLTPFAPTVSAPRLVTIGKLAQSLATFAPSVSTPRLATIGKLAVSVTPFAPVVSAPRLATVGKLALLTTTFAPTISATANQRVVPDTASAVLATFAPTAAAPSLVTPGVAALSLTSFTPTVSGGASLTATPDTAILAISPFAPSVSAPRLVTPDLASLSIASFAPSVEVGGPVFVTPGTVSLALTGFAPSVGGDTPVTGHRAGSRFPLGAAKVVGQPGRLRRVPVTVTIPSASLRLATFVPALTVNDDGLALALLL